MCMLSYSGGNKDRSYLQKSIQRNLAGFQVQFCKKKTTTKNKKQKKKKTTKKTRSTFIKKTININHGYLQGILGMN